MTSQGVDGTVDKAGRILPDSNQRVKAPFLKGAEIENLNLDDEKIFRPNQTIFLGGVTMPTLGRLFNEGDILVTLYHKFYAASRFYFQIPLDYILRKFPLNAGFNHQRLEVPWDSVQHFYDR